MKSTMNKGDIARMNAMIENGVKVEMISKSLGIDKETMSRFMPKKKKEAPKEKPQAPKVPFN